MRSIIVTFVLASFASGCGACAFPFSVEESGQITLPLGVMSAGCEGSGNERLENESTVSYTHRRVGTTCVVDATWTGPLFDMDELRDKAEERMREEGFDPEDVHLSLTSIDLTVNEVSLRDMVNNEPLDIEAPALVTYEAAISAADDEIIVLGMNEEDPSSPVVNVHDSNNLVMLANEAYAERATIPGTGVAHVVIDLTHIRAIEDAVQPALSLQYEIVVEGNAALR